MRAYLRSYFSKGFLVDLEDRLRAESAKAFSMIRDHSGLASKRAREAEGQARFRMWEQGFEDVCQMHGGKILEGSIIPGTDLKVFQPFMRFEVDGKGIILGLAAMPHPVELPSKNKSRRAGVTLNYQLTPRFNFDDNSAKVGDVFVLVLAARDRGQAGKIEELAVGVIDADYASFLFYESFAQFVASADVEETQSGSPISESPVVGPKANVTLKGNIIPFVPPEIPDADDEADDK